MALDAARNTRDDTRGPGDLLAAIAGVSRRHYCPLYGGQVNRWQCHAQTSVAPKNLGVCTGIQCQSPWRLCYRCLLQGKHVTSADPATGFCREHKASELVIELKASSGDGEDGRIIPQAVFGSLAFVPTPEEQRLQEACKVGGSANPAKRVPVAREAAPGRFIRRKTPQTIVRALEARGFRLVPRGQIRVSPAWERRVDQTLVDDLSAMIRVVGQFVPIRVKVSREDPEPVYKLIRAINQLRACEQAGLKTVWIRAYPNSRLPANWAPPNQYQELGHTDLDLARAINRLMLRKKRSTAYVADLFGRSKNWVVQHLNLLNLHPDVKAMMECFVPEEERLRYSIALLLVPLPRVAQVAMARLIRTRRIGLSEAKRLIQQEVQERAGLSS